MRNLRADRGQSTCLSSVLLLLFSGLLPGCSLDALKELTEVVDDILDGTSSWTSSSWTLAYDDELQYGGYSDSTASSGYECSSTDGGMMLAFSGETVQSWSMAGVTDASDRPRRAKLIYGDESNHTGSRTPSGSASGWSVPDDHSLSGLEAPDSWIVRLSTAADSSDVAEACPHQVSVEVDVATSTEDRGYSSDRRLLHASYVCTPGSGEFQLAPMGYQDHDGDGRGTWFLVPVLVAGDHLSPTAWLSEASVGSWESLAGAGLRLKVPTFGDTSMSGDDYAGDAAVELDEATPARSGLAAGLASAEATFLIEDVDPSIDEAAYVRFPTVTLTWACDEDGDGAVTRFRRPSAYKTALSSLPSAGTSSALTGLGQELLLRPDYAAGRLGLELRGLPHSYRTVDLNRPAAGASAYTFTVSEFMGISATGSLVPGPRPRLVLSSLSGGGETLSRRSIVLTPHAE